RPVLEVHGDILGIAAEELVPSGMNCVEARTPATVDLLVDLMTVEVVSEQVVAELIGPVVTQVNHRTDVGVSPLDRIAARFARASRSMIIPGRGQKVISEPGEFGRWFRHNERGVVGVGLVPEVSPLNHVGGPAASPVAAAMGHEQLSAFVMIETPRVASTMREDLDIVTDRMITPHPGPEFMALGIRRPRPANPGKVEHALDPVEPAVRTPVKAIQTLVSVLVTEPIEEH